MAWGISPENTKPQVKDEIDEEIAREAEEFISCIQEGYAKTESDEEEDFRRYREIIYRKRDSDTSPKAPKKESLKTPGSRDRETLESAGIEDDGGPIAEGHLEEIRYKRWQLKRT